MPSVWERSYGTAGTPEGYSDEFIRDRVDSGKDKERAQLMDGLAVRAKAGDQGAMQELVRLSQESATMDVKNYGRMLLRDFAPEFSTGYGKANDGGGFFGSVQSVGADLLKYGAPIAAGFIPGIGPIAAGAIAAGGNTAGRALQGDPFSLKSALLSGAAGYGGNALMGGQGLNGVSGIPGRLGIGGGGGAGSQVGNMTQSMGGGLSAGPGAASGAGAGAFSTAAGGGGGGGVLAALSKYGPLAMGALGAVGSYQDNAKANDLRERGIRMAEQDYAGRQPFRDNATMFATMPQPTMPDLSNIYEDPGNPYNRTYRRG